MEYLAYSPKTLGLQLKRIRKNKGLTQKQAGSALLLEQSTVSSVENGAPGTRLETLFRLLAVLELDMVLRPKKTVDNLPGEW